MWFGWDPNSGFEEEVTAKLRSLSYDVKHGSKLRFICDVDGSSQR
jgi:hypothetical protein